MQDFEMPEEPMRDRYGKREYEEDIGEEEEYDEEEEVDEIVDDVWQEIDHKEVD